jgi:hypothetical protein
MSYRKNRRFLHSLCPVEMTVEMAHFNPSTKALG